MASRKLQSSLVDWLEILTIPAWGYYFFPMRSRDVFEVAKEIAASVIVVNSKGESATHFYEKFGFISLPKLTDRLFLPMQTAEKL